ncbi:WD40-repeat-containing domain protein [Chiua virens]|nr:WD40-repeat-containing domain protein [Chiua virens]
MRMDEETLIGSARSPQTSPRSTSTMTSPKTLVSGGTSTLGTGRRRQLYSLADVVADLKKSNEYHAAIGEPLGLEENEPPAVDEKQQRAGAELFHILERRIETLDKQLRDFENASRELGSSVGIVWSACKLQEGLAKVLSLFRENAACLYPRKISRKPQEMLLNLNVIERPQEWRSRSTIPILRDELELEMLPKYLKDLASDLGAFIGYLSEFEEFNDEAISQSMRAFEDDLNYFSDRLSEYKHQFRSTAVQRYAHDLMFEIGSHIDEVTAALNIFIEIGVPTIWFHQQHATKNLLNVSTLSIVFGVVDASLLVCSSHMTGNVLANSVNIFWMSSLVFSIASGVNGLLGLTWKQSTYRSPVHRVPWWFLVWMKGSPLVFLVIAIACFSAGVVLFTYSSGQNPVTSAVIVCTTLIASSGLISISSWFVLERWTFLKQREQKWLEEVISETLDKLNELGIVRAHRFAMQWCCGCVAATRVFFARVIARVVDTGMLTIGAHKNATNAPQNEVAMSDLHPRLSSFSSEGPGLPGGRKVTHDTHLLLDVRDPRVRFQNAVRTVIKLQRTTKTHKPAAPYQSPGSLYSMERGCPKIIEGLKHLDLTQELFPHGALVRHVQFSPNGKYLATSSWDRTAVIFRVGETLTQHRTLVHVRGFVSQVAWSPKGTFLLTRFTRGLKLWSEDGVCKQTIDRFKTVSSAVWLPSGQGILSVEGNEVVKLDPLHGKVMDVYQFDHVRLINVAVTSDCQRLVAIGPSVPPADGPQPTRHTKVEKRIIVYNMHTKRKESQTPLHDDVRDIIISKRMSVVLVSFEQAPPQLWKLEIVRDRARTNGESPQTAARLHLKHTFAPNVPTQIAGSCYFGGKDEQFVFCIGKAGDVHVWDRDTAALLRYLRPMNMSESTDMTCIAWNNGMDDPMMFATGSHDGAVRIWSTAMVQRVSESENSTEDESDDSG